MKLLHFLTDKLFDIMHREYFNICPYNPKIAWILLQRSSNFPLSPRQPLSIRAATAAREILISPNDAIRYCRKGSFVLGSNEFKVFGFSTFYDDSLMQLVISHLSSIFVNKHIGIWFREESENKQTVIVKTVTTVQSLGSDPFSEDTQKKESFTLIFSVLRTENEIRLVSLRSLEKGHGGRALLALYNIAQQMEIFFITYSVDPKNLQAMRFYFHMDFGRPTDNRCTNWVVKISI